MTIDDAYKLIGASAEDDNAEVKKKYHKLIMQYHPDKHSDGDIEFATRKTQEINSAYELIIDSRSGKSKDFDWGLQVKVTYNRPARPRGRTNQNANIARSTFGYHCDFWNLWKPREEDEFSFFSSLYPDIYRKVQSLESEYNMMFFAPIVDRLTYFGAAEYVDPYAALCKLYNTDDLSDSIFLTVTTSCDVNAQADLPVKIIYDQSILGQPYAISFQLPDGTIIGPVHSMRSICLSLLRNHMGVTISGNISTISSGSEYDPKTRKHISVKRIKVQLHTKLDRITASPFGFANNYAQIKELIDYYSICSRYVNNHFNERIFTPEDTLKVYTSIFSKVKKPEIKQAPLYTLDYRVYERDARAIDGKAHSSDLGKLSLLDAEEKKLLCDVFGASRKYAPLSKVCNSTVKYYRYDGKRVFFLIRVYTQKDPNSGKSNPKHWHRINIQIYPHEV